MLSVAVTSVGGGVGQSVLQALTYSRLPLRTVGMDVRALSAGLYWTDEARLVPPASEEEPYIRALLSLCERERLDVLIPGADPELEPLARHRQKFAERGCEVIVATPEVVRLVQDKLGFFRFSEEHGLHYVPTYTLAEGQERAEELVYPVIVKPLHGSGSVGARLVHGAEVLRSLSEENGQALIVQRYLPPRLLKQGEDARDASGRLDQSNEISAHFVLSRAGNILGSYISVNRLKDGVPVEIDPDTDSPAYGRARAVAEALIPLGLVGPVNIQGRMTPDGAHFFEINPRFTGITCVRSAMGFREVDAVLLDFLGAGEEEARAALDFRPGTLGLRFVELNVVPRETVAGVRAVEDNRDGAMDALDRFPTLPDRVAVTGASGYVGRALLDELLSRPMGPAVVALTGSADSAESLRAAHPDNPRLTVRSGLPPDLAELLTDVGLTFHLAADRGLSGDTGALFNANAEYTRRLLQALRHGPSPRLVLLSSQSVYGRGYAPPWSEGLPPAPDTAYGLSKRVAEELVLNPTLGLSEPVVLRASRVYGLADGMRPSELPHTFAARAAAGEPLEVQGDGSQLLDLIHVHDVVSALLAAAAFTRQNQGPLVVNVGGGRPISVLELAQQACRAARQSGLEPPEILHREVPPHMDQRSFGLDIRRARHRLGWAPQVSLEEAMAELVGHFHEALVARGSDR
ncbi:MAG: hypothetical protein Kow00122_07460 [Thermoleophilia bacterium]